VVEKALHVEEKASQVAGEDHAPPAYNQGNEEGEIHLEDMEEREERGGNAAAAKCVHDEISHTVCSNRIVCGAGYHKRFELYCANNIFCKIICEYYGRETFSQVHRFRSKCEIKIFVPPRLYNAPLTLIFGDLPTSAPCLPANPL
jgi:hypothetical protein